MPTFGQRSLTNLHTAHPDLQKVCNEAIKLYDFSVICGHRDKAKQDKAVRNGKSKTPFPKSKHNSLPSLAVDLAPYPIDWNDTSRFYFLAGVMMGCAEKVGVKLRWGGDWNGDGDFKERFRDLPHFELKS